MQFPGAQGKPAVGIVFDCDLGNRIDDVLALALLFGLDGRNEARVVSLSVSKANVKAAALCDAIAKFYTGGFSRLLPVGLNENGNAPEDTKILTEPLARTNAEGKPAYVHGINSLNDTAECSALIRNALTAQHDQNAIVVIGGPATNVAKVLDLPGVKDLITRKVRYLVMTAGSFPNGDADFNIATDVAAAKKVLAEWPGQIIACGSEIGEALPFPGSSIEKDFAWSPAHPVVDAYRANKSMPYDASSADMATMLYAGRPNEGYFKLSEPGVIRIREDAGTEFTASANGKHRHLILDPAQKDRIIKAYVELASAKPVVRRPRFGQQQQQQEAAKPAAPKPADAKQP